MVKVLGVLDIFASLLLVVIGLNLEIGPGYIIIFAGYLFIKGIVFVTDAASIFDIGVGILLAMCLFVSLPALLLFVASGLLGIKGIMSLISFDSGG